MADTGGYEAASPAVAAGGNILPPFQIVVDILNKSEVMAQKVGNWWGVTAAANFMVSEELFATKISAKLCGLIPDKLREAAGIEISMVENKAEKGGTHFVLDTQVLGFDMKVLGEKALSLDSKGAAQFAEAFDAVLAALENMGLTEKADGIKDKIGNKVRNKIMEKMLTLLPEKLGEEGVKINIVIPECESSVAAADAAERDAQRQAEEDAQATAAMLGLGQPFDMICVIEDRQALAEDIVQPGGLGAAIKKFAITHIPDAKFNEIVAKKLQTKVPEALQERAGIVASCERVKGDEKQLKLKEGIQVRMKVVSFDAYRLLSMAKGKEFADGYSTAVSSLKTFAELGLKGMDEKLDAITAKVSGTVCEKVREKLTEVLTEKLHAKVQTA